MSEVFNIFIAGISGVFLGMALIYIAMRVTSVAAEKLERRARKNG